jgi:transcriptional regulator with AAA-type ATPase domain
MPAVRRVVNSSHAIIGKSECMQRVLDLITQVAPSRATVLITGESGTGKELVARTIHTTSPRADKPFVPVNTGSMPVDLLESTLFGHEKGAFTSATITKRGLFEVADQGTIFFDEIGTVGVETQAKLLRVIQEREFMRLGGTETIKVDVRIVAATNDDLKKLVLEGKFRDDLFYRLNVINIALPPLRDRKADVPRLLEHFLAKYCAENGCQGFHFTPAALKFMMDYDWPGNVRELENAVERAVVLASNSSLGPELLPEQLFLGQNRHPQPEISSLLERHHPLLRHAWGSEEPEQAFSQASVARVTYVDDFPGNLTAFEHAFTDYKWDDTIRSWLRLPATVRIVPHPVRPSEMPRDPKCLADFLQDSFILIADLDYQQEDPAVWENGIVLLQYVFDACPWLRSYTIWLSKHLREERLRWYTEKAEQALKRDPLFRDRVKQGSLGVPDNFVHAPETLPLPLIDDDELRRDFLRELSSCLRYGHQYFLRDLESTQRGAFPHPTDGPQVQPARVPTAGADLTVHPKQAAEKVLQLLLDTKSCKRGYRRELSKIFADMKETDDPRGLSESIHRPGWASQFVQHFKDSIVGLSEEERSKLVNKGNAVADITEIGVGVLYVYRRQWSASALPRKTRSPRKVNQ